VESLSVKRKATRSVIIAIIAVSLFAVIIYYSIPERLQVRSIAFALGPNLPNSSNSLNSTMGSLGISATVTFPNGTFRFIFTPGGLNATDIEEIQLYPVLPVSGVLPGNWTAGIVTQTWDWKTRVTLTGEKILDLGSLEVTNDTTSYLVYGGGVPPPMNITTHLPSPTFATNSTDYWNTSQQYAPYWHIDTGQIQNILPGMTGSANISISLDLGVSIHYQLITNVGIQTVNATAQWSGNWGTLQLFLDGGKLLGFRYNFPDISLRMITA
jgi:hypothetical protein